MSPRTELRCVSDSVILTPSLRSSCAADEGEWGNIGREVVVNKETRKRSVLSNICKLSRHRLLENLEHETDRDRMYEQI